MQVRNLSTGLVHIVPPGHWSLTSPDYEVVQAEKPKTDPKPKK